ncbi:MAG: ATP synthase F1 subunit epsilon [Candidatus Moranbacteria bacterium]|nr:ATP synthase F1 subunit epsilon [Candidatus Moranbacteria bacterium]
MPTQKKLKFKIVTPEKVVFDQDVDQVSLPTQEGQLTILPDHESLIGVIKPGEICINSEQASQCFLAVSDGFLEIDANQVRVFAETAETAEELSREQIEKAQEQAKQAIENRRNISPAQYKSALSQLERELIRLKVSKKKKRSIKNQ